MKQNALKHGTRNLALNPGLQAIDVRCDEDTLSVDLADGRTITVPLVWYPCLLNATSAQRSNWELSGAGYGIHWPDVDEDLDTEGLLAGAPSPEYTRRAKKKPAKKRTAVESGLSKSKRVARRRK